jgi:hypothetical protein
MWIVTIPGDVDYAVTTDAGETVTIAAGNAQAAQCEAEQRGLIVTSVKRAGTQ